MEITGKLTIEKFKPLFFKWKDTVNVGITEVFFSILKYIIGGMYVIGVSLSKNE